MLFLIFNGEVDNVYNDEDKLENIRKLKEEMEKELKKKGLLKEDKSQKSKKADYEDEEIINKLKQAVVQTHLDINESLSLYLINSKDYDASIENVIRTLEIFIQKATDVEKRLIYSGLVKFLRKDFKGAINEFSNTASLQGRYNLLLTKMYSGDNISNELASFLKGNPSSLEPFLLLVEKTLIDGDLESLEKVLKALSKLSSFWELVYSLYTQTAGEENLSKATRERIFSALVFLYANYVRNQSDVSISNNTCLSVHRAILRGETVTSPDFCIMGNLYNEARRYIREGRIEISKINKFHQTPEGSLFFGFYFFNEGQNTMAKKYFDIFKNKVKDYEIVFSDLKYNKVGMSQFLNPRLFNINGEKSDTNNIFETCNKYKGREIIVKYKNPEFVRLVFSEEHCFLLYSAKK